MHFCFLCGRPVRLPSRVKISARRRNRKEKRREEGFRGLPETDGRTDADAGAGAADGQGREGGDSSLGKLRICVEANKNVYLSLPVGPSLSLGSEARKVPKATPFTASRRGEERDDIKILQRHSRRPTNPAAFPSSRSSRKGSL